MLFDSGITLKSGELFLASNASSDGSADSAAGLYLRDTRFLNEFQLSLDGRVPESLSVDNDELTRAVLHLTNRASDALPAHQLSLVATITLERAMLVDLEITNYSHAAYAGAVELVLNADFRDLFDVRGFKRERRGERLPVEGTALPLRLRYRGVDGVEAATAITVEPAGAAEIRTRDSGISMNMPLAIGRGETVRRRVVVTPEPPGGWDRAAEASVSPVSVRTGHALLDAALNRSLSDLEALDTPFPEGRMPAAGIPWFVAPFGRDSLIVGLQTLYLRPERAIGTLDVLAALQGRREDPITDEQPGKILHEMRYGEMARTHEVPHRPYYGTVDATPLFAWLVAETAIWTDDRSVWERFRPHAERALDWCERFGDLDGDGLIEYPTATQSSAHISHKVWKDSHDSLHYPDGSPATGLIAAVEVQGYLFAAYDRLAIAAGRFGDPEWSGHLRARAERVRQLVETQFWLEDEGYYAQALDGEKRAIASMSSNPGHLLFAGLPDADRAERMAQRMIAPDLASGWGLRTLSSSSASYNPMSYHNGSVWPHDTSLAIAGLYRYGLADEGAQFAGGLLGAIEHDPMNRLPELYCGFPRLGSAGEKPVAYPVSCSPQAWAAGALPLVLRAMLGLRADTSTGALAVTPRLPDWLDEITIDGVQAGSGRGTIGVRRSGDGYEVSSDGLRVIESM